MDALEDVPDDVFVQSCYASCIDVFVAGIDSTNDGFPEELLVLLVMLGALGIWRGFS